MYSIGVDIGGSKIAAGIVGEDMKLVSKKSQPFPHTGNPLDSIQVIRLLIDGLLAENKLSIGDAACIGLAVPAASIMTEIGDDHQSDYHIFPLSSCGDYNQAVKSIWKTTRTPLRSPSILRGVRAASSGL
jgi:hypothetical protein